MTVPHNDNGVIRYMEEEENKQNKLKGKRISFTTRLSLRAYDAMIEIQRDKRRNTGIHTPLWKVVDEAVTAYAEQNGIKSG